MKTPFFITGFPRSRTAWLANLFTTYSTLCLHDVGAMGVAGLRKKVGEAGPLRKLGASDPILTLWYPELMKVFPTARWVYVDRPRAECQESFYRWIAGSMIDGVRSDQVDLDVLFDAHERAAEKLKTLSKVTVVPFLGLGEAAVIEAAWDWLLPDGPPFDSQRWKLLDGFNVQQQLTARSMIDSGRGS